MNKEQLSSFCMYMPSKNLSYFWETERIDIYRFGTYKRAKFNLQTFKVSSKTVTFNLKTLSNQLFFIGLYMLQYYKLSLKFHWKYFIYLVLFKMAENLIGNL